MNIKKLITFLVVIGFLGFIFFAIVGNWTRIVSHQWRFSSLEAVFTIIALFLIYPTNIYSWHLVTRALGLRISLRRNAQIWMLSNIGRFLPGGFWQYPGRIYLVGNEGRDKVIAVSAVVLEILLVLLVGFWISAIFLLFRQNTPPGGIIVISFLMLVSLLILSKERVTTEVIKILKKLMRKEGRATRIKLSIRWIPILAFAFFLQFLFSGIVLFFIARAAAIIPTTQLPEVIGIFAVSWIVGYLTIFAPAGLGVQEASIAGLLSFYMPFPVAIVVALLFRLLLLISEGIVLLIAVSGAKSRT